MNRKERERKCKKINEIKKKAIASFAPWNGWACCALQVYVQLPPNMSQGRWGGREVKYGSGKTWGSNSKRSGWQVIIHSDSLGFFVWLICCCCCCCCCAAPKPGIVPLCPPCVRPLKPDSALYCPPNWPRWAPNWPITGTGNCGWKPCWPNWLGIVSCMMAGSLGTGGTLLTTRMSLMSDPRNKM